MASSASDTSRAPSAAATAALDTPTTSFDLSKLSTQAGGMDSTIVDPKTAAAAVTNIDGSGPPPSSRLAHTTVCLPIVYGSVAFYLGGQQQSQSSTSNNPRSNNDNEYNTHRWTLYVRGPNNEDLSVCIAKVVFQLHPSFAQSVRELSAPPFEVTEHGWGEFEAQIRIVWKDTNEKSTLVSHGIKLYPPGSATNQTQPTMDAVIDETYDEVVFTDPNETFYRQLLQVSTVPKVTSGDRKVQECLVRNYAADGDDFQKLVEAKRFLQQELSTVKERMKLATEEVEQVDTALREVQDAKKAASAAQRSAKRAAAAAAAAASSSTATGSTLSKKQKTNP